MALEKTFIPYGAYWSSPFCRWQGSIAHLNSVELAATTTARFLASKEIPTDTCDNLVLGLTVPQQHSFYGAPWFGGMVGASTVTGPVVAQACATSARVMATAAGEIETGSSECTLGVTCDRTSNGPHIVYPNPKGIGGRGDAEDWVWDNFNRDPHAGSAMVATAENVAKEAGISTEEQHAIALLRHEQYQRALADDRAFQRRYMLPLEIRAGRKTVTVDADEGVFPTTAEGLAKLGPVVEGGTVTFGGQTHPADGNAGMFLCSRERAAELSVDSNLPIRVLAFGSARVEKAHMPKAVVPAAQQALQTAGVSIDDLAAIKTHNPFAINDAYFCKETGIDPENMNNYGSPLVYGHPQGPTGMRVMIELIEELALAGGGYGLFSGCAAGDTAMAVVLRVG
ncbi:MAG: acetyl-CoA acetyltransferase [Planctomycetes bacterium]|nr:acetyl-CoA acetyltransferase [Planctomycetota bacterium]MDP6425188.1 thiolase family protein [Planctomycetota bacterium]